jgi:subfamily B ATP-binding cassette protein HlyB/CyaB
MTESPPNSGLLGLAMLARFHGVAADPDQLAHQFKSPGQPFGTEHILLAAKSLGLKAKRVTTEIVRLDRTPLPALAATHDGRYFILARFDGDQALIQHPGEVRPQVVKTAELAELWNVRQAVRTLTEGNDIPGAGRLGKVSRGGTPTNGAWRVAA